MESLESALKLYKLDNGSYPTTEQGMKALVEAPTIGTLSKNWRQGGYLEKAKYLKTLGGTNLFMSVPVATAMLI